ncbi:Sgt1-like protein [Spironucleus salmonicida]|uniref:SGS domain-containing protein n=1 Tax=Spironucleus salmonicida TaxID=348837 RepID=V6LQJ3_9EUKA|nr:Sgt1-like protein [Spironucleus salmonicida]|eukprot:EST46518.1 SGS domain-containing protein [Spironucleus salmonicida]
MLPRSQYYQVQKELFVEIYIADLDAKIEQINQATIRVVSQGKQYIYELCHDAKLKEFNCKKTKIELTFTTDNTFSSLLKQKQQTDDFEKYKQLDKLGNEDGSTDVMDQIREIYKHSDDKTKESMMKSWHESQGKVIAKDW